MKKGYKKLLIFQVVMLLFIIINSFFHTYLKGYGFCLFLLLFLFILKKIFGFEKDKSQYKKDILLETFIFLLIFFIYYSCGIFIGFASVAKYNIHEFVYNVMPLLFSIILMEYIRYIMLCKSEFNNVTTVLTVVIFILFDITNYLLTYDFSTGYNIFKFIAMIFLPAICKNIAYSMIMKKTSFKTVLFYSIVIGIYPYIIPIVPNVSEYLYSLISMILPIIFLFRISYFYEKEETDKEEEKVNNSLVKFIPLYAVLAFIIGIYSGYFRYWVIVIASGSMTPNIQIGDLVLIDKKYDESLLDKGQVIAYKNNNTIIVHRITEKVNLNGTWYYITKGDANFSNDNLLIDHDMILGVVKTELPYLGLPTIWIHEMFE